MHNCLIKSILCKENKRTQIINNKLRKRKTGPTSYTLYILTI